MKQLLLTACLGLFLLAGNAQFYQPNWESLDTRPVPHWYKDAKFGIFIHWGVYSVPAWSPKGSYSEWYQNSLQSGGNSAIRKFHAKKYGPNFSYYVLPTSLRRSGLIRMNGRTLLSSRVRKMWC